MAKKIVIPEDEVRQIIKLYTEDKLGTPTLSSMFNYHKSIINRTLKENGVELDTSGRRYLGGKKVSDSKYYKKNKDKILERYSEWSKENRSKLREYHTKWREENKDKLNKKKRVYEKNKKDLDPKYKLSSYTRTAIYTCLKERNIKKYSKTFNLLPYTLEELMAHLEKQFSNGMSWDNYGEWHVDHIKPISSFNIKEEGDNQFLQCWSLKNLRPLWGEENISKGNKILAHQYRIRIEKEVEEKEKIGFDYTKASLKNCIVKPIDRFLCEKIIKEYEWLGYLPKYTKYYFGLFFNIDGEEFLGGVVAYQPEYGDNIGVWDKYGFTGKIIQLSRGVCLWWTPKNSASFMISKTLNWVKNNTDYEIVSATVDPNAGEIGTIYQSLGWYYVGCMSGNLKSNGEEIIRYGYKIDGKIYNQRHIRKMIGTAKKEEVLKHFPNVEIFNAGRKRRYFKFIKNEDLHKKSIENIIKTYPKR
jgi:hypothetical protein